MAASNGTRRLKGEPPKQISAAFDLNSAREMTDAFSSSCQVHCDLYNAAGQLLHQQGPPHSDCTFCRKLTELTGDSFSCEKLHSYAAFQSERFGGRYIYSCPVGMTFFSSPILMGGSFAGALVAGPVLIVELDDFLANDNLHLDALPPEQSAAVKTLLLCVPQTDPRRLEHLSSQLFANAVYISDSSHELFLSRQGNEQQNAIGDYIARLKQTNSSVNYPIEQETMLCRAISHGDRETAADLLNEILGYIFFYTSSPEESRSRVAELLVVLSRAAIQGGANVDQIFAISQQYMQDMRRLNTQAELTRWLANSLNRFANLVFDLMDVKHRNAMHSAIDYIKANYTDKITLDEVAQKAGYSPAYFSKLFKDEIGVTFKEYLNELRVERSKFLLLSGNSNILEICNMVGFKDQSYFCKTFKKITGVSPDTFRKRARRIDPGKEYGLK